MKRTTLIKVLDTEVAGSTSDLQTTPIIPVGKEIRIREFGGCIPYVQDGSMIILQVGSASTWQTIKAGSGTFELRNLPSEIIGDGTKRLRLVRWNKGLTAKTMVAWVDCIVMEHV